MNVQSSESKHHTTVSKYCGSLSPDCVHSLGAHSIVQRKERDRLQSSAGERPDVQVPALELHGVNKV